MNFLRQRWVQILALTALLAGIGVYSMKLKFAVTDFDTWWHLKVGDWIVENSALPHTGILSRTAADRPWIAYSWGYEVFLSRAYAWLGLIGIGVVGTLLTVGVVFSTYWMLRRLSGRFWLACALAGISCLAFLFTVAPRPVFFSYMFYCVTLSLLLEAQCTGRIRLLYWLPLVFAIWANLHIQFVYGLFTLALFVAVHLSQQILSRFGLALDSLSPSRLPAKPLIAVLGASFVATLVGPNTYHPYLAVLAYTKAKFAYKIIIELQPLPFRTLNNFVELLLAAAGFYAVGWRKKLDPFQMALLVAASVVSFRTMRDAWFISLSAAACIANFPAPDGTPHLRDSWRELAVVTVTVALLLILASPLTNFTTRGLDRAISADYPVNAINFLRRNSFSGPLYNNLNWGGFLMWYLPELPVAIDGRNDLYGDDLDSLFYYSESAYPSYRTDPYLNESGIVVLQSKLPLAKVLTIDPRFRLVYRDEIATVFTRNEAVMR